MNSLKIVVGALFCLVVSLLECAPRKHTLLSRVPSVQAARLNPLDSNPEARQAGARMYASHCAGCHGRDRQGIGSAPALADAKIYNAPPGTLFWILRRGAVFTGMPDFADLPELQRWQIVTFLKDDHTAPATRSR
jgi:mono/diheme cytochrome c family protein